MRLLILILLFATSAFSQIPAIEPGVSEGLAKWRSAQYSNISYKLNLTLEKMSPVLRGSMEIRVTQAAYACAEPDCPPMAIILDWRKIPGHEKDSTISNVTLNGSELRLQPRESITPKGVTLNYEESNEHLIFRDGVKMGENVIKLDFTSPILTSGSAITRYVDKEDGSEYIYSLFVPSDASTAFPVFDQPDLKARFSLSIHPPGEWKVVTNSQIENTWTRSTIEMDGTYHRSYDYIFAETKPISTYVFAFAAGPFHRFVADYTESYETLEARGSDNYISLYAPIRDPNKTKIFVRKSQATKFKPHAAEVFRLNQEAVKYFETYFDYKFPFPKYDLVLIPEFPFGGMEHAGATFLREQTVIFPQEPTKNDVVTRANLIFHEAAHQWFGDTVTMKWFDDLWLKEGFATFMAYKALDKIMPEMNAWKVFYERVKQAAYRTDSTRGTTAIYQPVANLSAAKSAYGNIVYNKAPAFLRQAEFYLGEDKFQTAVRAFLKKHEFANASWEDLVKEFQTATKQDLSGWAQRWVLRKGLPIIRVGDNPSNDGYCLYQTDALRQGESWPMKVRVFSDAIITRDEELFPAPIPVKPVKNPIDYLFVVKPEPVCFLIYHAYWTLVFPNYRDYGYGIFLLDDKSRDYVLKNIQNERDDFLRTMMWGSLWDSVREGELDPKDYVELVIKNLGDPLQKPARSKGVRKNEHASETDESTIQTLLGRVTTAMNYYVSVPGAVATGAVRSRVATAPGTDLQTRLENLLIDKIQNASTQGQRITYYRAFLNIASTDRARDILKQILNAATPKMTLKTKDKFDIVTRLAILGDKDAAKLLATLEKTETSDDAKRYAYAAHAAFATAENKAKFWNDFINNKDISESWVEDAVETFNSIKHSELTLPYLEKALAELPKLKRERKIFFVNGWLAEFIGGQRSKEALDIVNKFLADNPNLDNDLRLKILENSDVIERAVKIRAKYKN